MDSEIKRGPNRAEYYQQKLREQMREISKPAGQIRAPEPMEPAIPQARLEATGTSVRGWFTAIGVVLICMGVISGVAALVVLEGASDAAWAPLAIGAVLAVCAGCIVIALGRFVSALGDTIAAIATSVEEST